MKILVSFFSVYQSIFHKKKNTTIRVYNELYRIHEVTGVDKPGGNTIVHYTRTTNYPPST